MNLSSVDSCGKCGLSFETGNGDGPQACVSLTPRPRPSVVQQCPGCGELNRPGVIICEICGTNLVTGERAPLSTRLIGIERVENVPVEGGETLDVEQYQRTSRSGTSVFDNNMILRIHVEDSNLPVLLRLTPGHCVLIGRSDAATGSVDIDLTTYSGYNRGISRHHAALELHDRRLELWDLASSNGTYLNGIRLEPNEHHQLRDGDELRLGKMIIHVFFQQKIARSAHSESGI